MTRQKTQDIWEQRILAWKASGKTARSWCQEHGIPLGSFYQWRKRLSPKIVSIDAFIPKQPEELLPDQWLKGWKQTP